MRDRAAARDSSATVAHWKLGVSGLCQRAIQGAAFAEIAPRTQEASPSRATLYRKIDNGTFPRQLKLSTRFAGWRESAVNDWMKNPTFYSVEGGQ